MWAVMKAYPVSSITADGIVRPFKPDKGQPTRIIPVFDTYEEAVAWHGSFEDIAKLDVIEP